MMSDDTDWIGQGRGRAPRLIWSVATDAPLVSLKLGRESGDLLAGDTSGGLYLIDRYGKITSVTRGKTPLRALSWSDNGHGGICLVGEDKLYWLNRDLAYRGWVDLPQPVTAIALESNNHYAAVSLADGTTQVYDSNRKVVSRFETPQPLVAVEFLVQQPGLVGITEYGLLCRFNFDGSERWNEKLWTNIGDMAITGDGKMILLACFTLGIQAHDGNGEQIGSFQIGGTVSRIACSYVRRRIAAVTVERNFCWMDFDGQILWQSILPSELCRMSCDPFGAGVICGFQSGRIQRIDWDGQD